MILNENDLFKGTDYAVMEKVNNAVVIPVDIGWSDVGSWSALHEIGESDENNNLLIGDNKDGLAAQRPQRAITIISIVSILAIIQYRHPNITAIITALINN